MLTLESESLTEFTDDYVDFNADDCGMSNNDIFLRNFITNIFN